MKYKRGFTLAEILIALSVIGVMVSLTIPSLMKGVIEAQRKTAYKKALNTMINLVAVERLSGSISLKGNTAGADSLFDSFRSNLNVKAYVLSNAENSAVNSGKIITSANYNAVIANPNQAGRHWYWVITEDNMAYVIKKGNGTDLSNSDTTGNCKTKLEILELQRQDGTEYNDVCYTVYVDINGLSAGPNTAYIADNKISRDEMVPELTHDQFPIYIASNGATAGNQVTTITGRIAADMQ